MSGDLRREIVFEPGYDHRAEDANKPRGQRRGCHGLTMRWLVHGEHGTTSFTVFTGWLPSWVKPGRWGDVVTAPDGEPAHAPMAADLGHHWDSPTYSGEGSMECHYRPSGRPRGRVGDAGELLPAPGRGGRGDLAGDVVIAVAVASMVAALTALLARELVRQARLLDAYEAEVDALIEDLETERARRRKAEARANHLTGDVVRLKRT